ncbi:MAG: L-threonylcarbamoyladenylate synthase [bacterium]|nr:L-threonylcarbamoyladenylate synthase [bacterium]
MYITKTTDVLRAVKIIQEGRIVAFPTGTSYGLAVNALFGHGLQRLRNIKKRPAEKAFSVFMKESLWDTYLDLTDKEREILHKFSHSALTLLVRPKPALEHIAQNGCIALRVIDHELMQGFADTTALPLTATSANISGQEAIYNPDEIEAVFPGKDGTTYDLSLGCILDGGNLQQGAMSTIAKYENGKLTIIRQGSLHLSS